MVLQWPREARRAQSQELPTGVCSEVGGHYARCSLADKELCPVVLRQLYDTARRGCPVTVAGLMTSVSALRSGRLVGTGRLTRDGSPWKSTGVGHSFSRSG